MNNNIERNITITLEKAREWYNSGNDSLKEVALQAFDEKDLANNFRSITSFSKACEALGINNNTINIILNRMVKFSRASAAMFKLNIIRKALNLGQDLHLTKNPRTYPEDSNSYCPDNYFPYNPLSAKYSTHFNNTIDLGIAEVIGKVKNEGEEYYVLGGDALRNSITNTNGLSSFSCKSGVGFALADLGFLGCATKEIAQHFGKYFGMLITEAKYGDLPGFEIIETKYLWHGQQQIRTARKKFLMYGRSKATHKKIKTTFEVFMLEKIMIGGILSMTSERMTQATLITLGLEIPQNYPKVQ